jgi:hypothetical protein
VLVTIRRDPGEVHLDSSVFRRGVAVLWDADDPLGTEGRPLLPEVVGVDELDGEPEAPVPQVVRRLEKREQLAAGGANRVEIGLGFVRVPQGPGRLGLVAGYSVDGAPEVMRDAHDSHSHYGNCIFIRTRISSSSRADQGLRWTQAP